MKTQTNYKMCKKIEILTKVHFLIDSYYITGQQEGRKSLPGTKKDIRFFAFGVQLHMVYVKHKLFKNNEKSVKIRFSNEFQSKSGIPF